MATPHTVIDIPQEQPAAPATSLPFRIPQETTSSSWVPSWFPGSPLRPTVTQEKPTTKPKAPVAFQDDTEQAGLLLRKMRSASTSAGAEETSDKPNAVTPAVKERLDRHESMPGGSKPPATSHKADEPKRKSKAAPAPPLSSLRTATMRSNFSYDTLKERADVWKKEKRQRPVRVALEREDSFVEKAPDRSRKHVDPMEDGGKPKIRFTQEESDKVDKDILRLMGAVEHNRYPFNRDKHLLFNKLRLIRRKQMGLLFAHRELDGTRYFDTDREDFGYDVIFDQLGTMYNVIDAISRDVYELRELLYYERKNQTPPNRRGSSDRRTSSEPPPTVHLTKPTSFPTRAGNAPFSSFDGIDGSALPVKSSLPPSTSPKLPVPSSTRPILKHSLSAESFKSAKSDDTMREETGD